MATDKPDLSEAVRRLAEGRRPQEHPPPETLAEYHARELPAEEIPSLQDHLAECPECSQMLLDLEAFEELEPPEGQPPVSETRMQQDWRRLRRRLRSEDGHPRVAGSRDRGSKPRGSARRRAEIHVRGETEEQRERELPPAPRFWLRRPGRLLAAAAAVVAVGVGIWAVGTRPGPPGKLRVNVPPVELRPVGVGTTRGGESAAPARDLHTTGAYLVLHDAPAPSGNRRDGDVRYEVVMREASTGAVEFRRGDLRALDRGFFSLVIEPGVLREGEYRIEVRSTGSTPDFSQEYELTVSGPDASS